MKYVILIYCTIVFCFDLPGQEVTENLSGQVSFISSQNIYVRFKSTAGISAGDTLFMNANGALIPALVVKSLSSTSCVCTKLTMTNPALADPVVAKIKRISAVPEEKVIESSVKEIPSPEDSAVVKRSPPDEIGLKQRISGSVAAVSYSDFSNTPGDNSQRFRYTLSLDARHIAGSKFSAESYISFRHKSGDWEEVKDNIFNALKIYSLAVRYDLNKTMQISLGRRINPRITSIGASDGLQVEKSFKRFALGGLVGSRPDYADYGFNFDLFQFGAYMAYNYQKENTYSETSLAFMQQMNHSKTDRRFLYFQHSNSLLKNLYFFGTLEVDLYELKVDTLNNDKPQNTFDPTGIFLSLRYRITKKLTISGSYDARKNVVYYETYKTYVDRILETEMRQGLRIQANYKIAANFLFGLQMGYRFLPSDPKPSRNLNGFFTYSRIPGINVSATLSATFLETNYMNGNIYGLNLSRDLLNGKIYTGVGYRYVDYRLPENLLDIVQHMGELHLSWQFYKNMSLALNYEGTFEQQDRYNRIYAQLRARF